MSGTLYVCATPIGNLEDITFRVLNCLKEVDLIAAEDTRNSIRLLNYFGIKTPMTSYHEYNKYDKAAYLVREIQSGKNVAIITDAGTPCISDPGEELVRECAEAGIPVTSLPGPSAVVTALTLSGLPTRRFAFEAFLPQDKKERARVFSELETETRTMIFYEAPHRLKKTLAELCHLFGGSRRISLCRELTKTHEEVLRLTLEDAVKKYEDTEPKGEYVLVIAGKTYEEIRRESESAWENMTVPEHISYYMAQGISEKDALKKTAKDRGMSRREVYAVNEREKNRRTDE